MARQVPSQAGNVLFGKRYRHMTFSFGYAFVPLVLPLINSHSDVCRKKVHVYIV